MEVSLFKCVSERTDENGQNYIDLFVTYTYENKPYVVRIRPCFKGDYKLLVATAKAVKDINSAVECMS